MAMGAHGENEAGAYFAKMICRTKQTKRRVCSVQQKLLNALELMFAMQTKEDSHAEIKVATQERVA